MIRLHCRQRHGHGNALCEECAALLAYAQERLDRCPYQERKPTCGRCTVHCYRPERREQVRAVMRYAGPRMLWSHPWLALAHLFDGLRKAPATTKRGKSS